MMDKLVILGGNPETAAFVENIKKLGIFTIVIDPNENAPAKKCADISYDIDVLDVDTLINFLKTIDFDGIIVGVADILVPSYYKVCKEFGLNCYANEKTIEAFGSKDGFNKICEKNNIKVTPRFNTKNYQFQAHDFPLLIKPVDNGAGVGISICKDVSQLNAGIDHAVKNSKSGRILIEKYMTCDDLWIYYTFISGNIYLSASGDRYTSKNVHSGSPVCIGATYPSKYHNEFTETINPQFVSMLKKLNIKDGVLCVQFFKDDEGFYAYDPGFRLQGEGQHIHMLHALNVDQRELLASFALSKTTDEMKQLLAGRYVGDKLYAATGWVLLKIGKIEQIKGLEEIRNLRSFKECLQRFFEGDKVTNQMIGTERQVFARFYFQNTDKNELREDVRIFSKLLEVSCKGESLISDIFDETYL